jgi:hypothetical protein
MAVARRLSCVIVGLYILVVGSVDKGQDDLAFLRCEAGIVLTAAPARGFEPAASEDIPTTEAEAAAKERSHLYRLASHSGQFCGTATRCVGFVTLCKDRYCDAAACPISSHIYPCGICVGFGDWVPPVAPPYFGGGCRDDP